MDGAGGIMTCATCGAEYAIDKTNERVHIKTLKECKVIADLFGCEVCRMVINDALDKRGKHVKR